MESRNEGNGNSNGNGKVWGFTHHQWKVLLMVTTVNFCAGLAYSILAPLYPREAQTKGVPAGEFGFVFGIYELSNFLVAPIFGKYMGICGPKPIFHVGMMISAGITIAFSFLAGITGHIEFITTSFLLRIPQSIGATGVLTASFTIVAVEFPSDLSLAFAIVETIFGIACCFGPVIGASLYQLGGFALPFQTLGGIYMICAIISIVVFWNDDFNKKPPATRLKSGGKTGLLSLLTIPSVALPMLAAFVFEVCTGVITVLMEPILRKLDLTPLTIGLVFLLYAAVYSTTAPVWGTVCDRLPQPMYVSLAGSVLLFVGFVFFGPAPFLPVSQTVWMTIVGLVLISFGYGANNVSSYTIAMRQARLNGFSDSVGTYSLVSGAWTSSVAFGSCVGPSLAGILYDTIGIRYQTLFNLGLIALLMIFLIGFITTNKRPNMRSLSEADAESEPILRRRSQEPVLVH